MPAAGSLAALMKEWPLNSVMLSTATHSKLREALDGIDTQVATCAIDRWTAKMKGAEEYITREISWREGGQFRRHQKALVVQYQRRRRRTHPRTRPNDGLWPSPQLCCWRSVPQRSCPTVDEVLAKAQLLNPLLYQIHCIGPIGFGFAHIYSKRHPLNRDPTVIIVNFYTIKPYYLNKRINISLFYFT